MRQIILESNSAAEVETRLATYYIDWTPERLTELTAEALEAFAANGTSLHTR